MQLQAVGLVHIAQQCFFLCDGRLLARFGDFGPLHQFGRLVAQKAPVRPQAAVAGVLFLLGPAAPALGAARGLAQPGDVLFQPFVFRAFAVVLHAFVFLPDGEIPLHHGDVTAVQYQHMVGAAVQQVSVVGNQDISPFLRQIFTQKAVTLGHSVGHPAEQAVHGLGGLSLLVPGQVAPLQHGLCVFRNGHIVSLLQLYSNTRYCTRMKESCQYFVPCRGDRKLL